MVRFRVRRLTVIDLCGGRGRGRRRGVVLAEFFLSAVAGVAVGAGFLARGGVGDWLVGVYAVGVGLNYAALAGWALRLSDPARLRAEYQALDPVRDASYYARAQFAVLLPFVLLPLSLREVERRP